MLFGFFGIIIQYFSNSTVYLLFFDSHNFPFQKLFLEINRIFCYNQVKRGLFQGQSPSFLVLFCFFIKIRFFGGLMNISKISRLPSLILHYGLFASICHAISLLLYSKLFPAESFFLTFHTFFPLLEHSLVSFICVLLGALLCFYIAKKEAT